MGEGNSKQEMKQLTDISKQSKYSIAELKVWYERFKDMVPNGYLTKAQFKIMYANIYPNGNADAFAEHVFRVFDDSHDQKINFREFMTALAVQCRGTMEEKLHWMFSLFDVNGDGKIRKTEMLFIMRSLYKLHSARPILVRKETAHDHVEKIFKKLGRDQDGELTLDEFLKVGKTDPKLTDMLSNRKGSRMMKSHVFLLVVVGLVGVCSSYEAYKRSSAPHTTTWNYGENGPETWGGACRGKSQSPINIVTSETSKSTSNNRITHNYETKASGKYTIKNNGHALQMDIPDGTKYKLQKGLKTYTPVQIHIHFDPLTGKGSEHTLNSHKYFAEIHIVHEDTESDGLLVIGMFVDLVKKPDVKTSFAMQVFRKAARKLIEPDSETTRNAFPLVWLLPKVKRKNWEFDYVNYNGSLTTPPCSEIVDWIVITGKVLQVNEQTAMDFEYVMNSSGGLMAGNNRPIQNLNGRHVYGVKGEEGEE